MTPVNAGRHCAACEKTVVDFTLKTDAEILAFLAGATSGRTCGRFAAGQLERPLQRAVPAVPTRWRAWLAAAVAVWAVREGVGESVKAQAPTEWRARYWGGPVSAAPAAGATVAPAEPDGLLPLEARKPLARIARPEVAQKSITMGMVSSQAINMTGASPLVLRGIITDYSNHEVLPGVTVLLKGTTIGTSTHADGTFELAIPPQLAGAAGASITVSSVGYVMQERQLAAQAAGEVHTFQLQADVKGMMGLVVVMQSKMPPAPWHPRRFYYWGRYWLTRPFRRG